MTTPEEDAELQRIARDLGLSAEPSIDYDELFRSLDTKKAEAPRQREITQPRLVWSNGRRHGAARH